jgi:hypothetical protein
MLRLNLVVPYYYKNAANTSGLSFDSEGRSATKSRRSSPVIEKN